MSQYKVISEDKMFVYGWDPPTQSFFFQKHDLNRRPDEQVVVWLGGDKETQMRESETLVRAAETHGLKIDYEMLVKLYEDQDEGR